jgi:hypothetical protein
VSTARLNTWTVSGSKKAPAFSGAAVADGGSEQVAAQLEILPDFIRKLTAFWVFLRFYVEYLGSGPP